MKIMRCLWQPCLALITYFVAATVLCGAFGSLAGMLITAGSLGIYSAYRCAGTVPIPRAYPVSARACLCMAAAFVAIFMFGVLHGLMPAAMGMEALADPAVWLYLLYSCVVGPFFEEAYFRGFLYRRMRHCMGSVLPMLLSSALFFACHGPGTKAVPVLCIAVCLCVLHEATGTWVWGMLVHCMYNVVNTWGEAASLPFPGWAAVLAAWCAGGLTVLLVVLYMAGGAAEKFREWQYRRRMRM